jgi:hypothetical protein
MQDGNVSRQMKRVACGLPRRELVRIWNGYHPDRSGDIQFVPREPHFMGDYLSHSGPWDYLQRVPMLWYGPGFVPAQRRVDRRVTMADVAPTIARYLGFQFRAPDGRPMREALPRTGDRGEPPRLVLMVVWDGGGRDVLEEHPRAWPNLSRLIRRGVWYENAVVGSSPSHTAAVHASLGTGAHPRTHGRIDGVFLMNDRLVRPEGVGPRDLLVPSLADLYDRAHDNDPLVGVVGATPWHLGMAGQGSFFPGGDRDMAVLQTKEFWGLSPHDDEYFEAPSYATSDEGYTELVAEIDREDGVIDGSWYDDRFVDGPNVLLKHSTVEWQTRIVRQLLRREGFGSDFLPDLMFINYKQIDAVGHSVSMNSADMGAVVQRSDEALAQLIRLLNDTVGKGRWVLGLTADHGSTPSPSVSGGWGISVPEFGEDLRSAFDDDGDDRDILEITRVSQLWVDPEEMQENEVSLEQISRWMMGYTIGDNASDPSQAPTGRAAEKLFASAFPAKVLQELPCLPPD